MEIPDIVDSKNVQKALDEAVSDDTVVKIYANGFIVACGQGDVIVLLQKNGKHVSILNLSFSVAKTLALSLGKTIKDLENRTEKNIMTTFDIKKALSLDGKEEGEKDE